MTSHCRRYRVFAVTCSLIQGGTGPLNSSIRHTQTMYAATQNLHKLEEIRGILGGFFDVKAIPTGLPICPENAISFESNALEKAVYYARFVDGWVLADDSGLAVDALDGRPGVLSARYAGVHGDDEANNQKLLRELSGYSGEARCAQFVCAIALWNRKLGHGIVTRGEVAGTVLDSPSGQGGFGYDPLFYVPEIGATLADVPPEVKNEVSHRRKALEAMLRQWSLTELGDVDCRKSLRT